MLYFLNLLPLNQHYFICLLIIYILYQSATSAYFQHLRHMSVKQYLLIERMKNEYTHSHGKNNQVRKVFWDVWTHSFSTESVLYVLLWDCQSSFSQVLFLQFQLVSGSQRRARLYLHLALGWNNKWLVLITLIQCPSFHLGFIYYYVLR